MCLCVSSRIEGGCSHQMKRLELFVTLLNKVRLPIHPQLLYRCHVKSSTGDLWHIFIYIYFFLSKGYRVPRNIILENTRKSTIK